MKQKYEKGVFAWDLDETLVPTLEGIKNFYNFISGKNLQVKDYISYNLSEVWRISREESKQIISDFYDSDFFKNLKPFPEAQEIVRNVSKKIPSISITARPKRIHSLSEEFVKNYFPSLEKILSVGSEKETIHSKLSYCLENDVKYLADDNANTVSECSSEGIICFLPKRLYNKNLWDKDSKERIIPIDNLIEVEEYFKDYKFK